MAVRKDFREFFKREKIKVGKELAITGLIFPTDLTRNWYWVQVTLLYLRLRPTLVY